MVENESFRPKHYEQPQSPDLIHPYLRYQQEKFAREFPDNAEAMNTVIEHIAEQTTENYDTYHSEKYPGVEVPYTTVAVTPELIEKIAGHDIALPTETVGNHRNLWRVLFAGQTLPKDGHAFTTMDMSFNDVLRGIPPVAKAMKKGTDIPDVSILMLGLPNGLGGRVTPEFYRDVDNKGFLPHALVDAELINNVTGINEMTPEQLALMEIIFRGASKGTIIADLTRQQFPEEIQDRIQTYLYNPAGTHKPGLLSTPLKGGQVIAGLAGEMVSRMKGDPIMGAYATYGADFTADLQERFAISPDEWEQQKWKYLTFIAEGAQLVKGTPLDTDFSRHHIVENLRDPLSTGMQRVLDAKQHFNARTERFLRSGGSTTSPLIAQDRGSSIAYTADNGYHFFTFDSPERFDTILSTVKSMWSPLNQSR